MTRGPRATAFYERPGLHLAIYDALHATVPGGDDIAFFRGLAERTGGPILELGAGTGRVAIPLAEAGFEVVALDRSAAALRVAETKRSTLPRAVRSRLRLVCGDMTDYRLRRRFGLVVAAFRVFMHLLDGDAQRAALACARNHLRPGGLLALDVFDPLLDRLVPVPFPSTVRAEVALADSGNLVRVTTSDRVNDPLAQRFTELWTFVEVDPSGRPVREETEALTLRWTFRYEMQHLLELAGFDVEAEHSDYAGSPPAYAGEQIWVARRPIGRR